MSTKTSHFFSADRPIERLDDDRLQRRSFATSIAQAITTWHGDDSLVMALYGGWGDGKSSVKGMVVDAMKKDADTCPFIVYFNPWEWAGQNQLAQVFFEEIGKQIAEEGVARNAPNAQEAGSKMRSLGKYLSFGASLAKVAKYGPTIARFINSMAGSPESQAQMEGSIAALEPYADTVAQTGSAALEEAAKISEQGADAAWQTTTNEKESLRNIKGALAADLKKLGKNVLVLVDDIDRLAADEIKLLFQLIKANSDFPNLIFFLFFQRDIIERALGRTIRTGTGKDYLEKIVQVPLSLPRIQRPLLEDFMDSKLRELLARRGLEKAFEWSRFKEMWQEGLSGYFQNVRDVARFFGTFEFQVAAFPDPAEFDPVDLFALEVIRLFEDGVYQVLARSGLRLSPNDLDLLKEGIQDVDPRATWEKAIKHIAVAGKATKPEAVEAVLTLLFPSELFAQKPENLTHLLKNARVGHPAFLGRYFYLCIPQGDIPQTQLRELHNAPSKPAEFKRLLVEFDKQKLALEALTRLLAYTDTINVADAKEIAVALCDLADAFVSRYDDNFWTGYAAMSCLLIEAYLDRLPTGNERFSVLKAAFERTTGVYLPAVLLTRESSRENEYQKKDAPRGLSRDQSHVLTRPQLKELGDICVKAFKWAAASDTLKTHLKLKDILVWWDRWAAPSDAVKDYFRKMVATDDGLLTVLVQYLGDKLSDDEHRKFVDNLFDRGLSDLELFMPVGELKHRVEEVRKGKLSEPHTRLCNVFMEVYEERARSRAVFPAVTPVQPDPAAAEDNSQTASDGIPSGDGKP